MKIQYLVTIGNPEDEGPGRPHATYLLNHKNLVTEPKSATILLELLRTSKVDLYYIQGRDFVSQLTKKHCFAGGSVKRKFGEALKNRYILHDPAKDLLRRVDR